MYSSVHWTSHFLKGTRKTQLYLPPSLITLKIKDFSSFHYSSPYILTSFRSPELPLFNALINPWEGALLVLSGKYGPFIKSVRDSEKSDRQTKKTGTRQDDKQVDKKDKHTEVENRQADRYKIKQTSRQK